MPFADRGGFGLGQTVSLVELPDALVQALDVQVAVCEDITREQLALGSMCEGWTVGDVINHSVGTTTKFAAFASGATDSPHAPDGDLVGPDHRHAVRAARNPSGRRAGPPPTRRGRATCRSGTFSSDLAAGINLFDVVAHTWDIAVPTSTTMVCPDAVWEAALRAAAVVLGRERGRDHYDRETAPAPGDSAADRLLRFLGREPHP